MPDQIAVQLAKLGLTMDALLMLPILVVPTVELVKKHTNVKGSKLLAVSAGVTLAWSLLFFLPEPKAVMGATLIGTVLASGGFQGLKTLLGKVGEDKK